MKSTLKAMTRSVVFVLCLMVFLPAAARTDALDPGEISANAQWAVHLDVKGLLSCRIGSHLLGMLEKDEEMAKVDAFGTIFEFDFREDLHSVTAYGTSFAREEGVVLVEGRFDKEKLLALMQAEGGKQKEIEFLDFVILEWTDGGDRFFICFYQKNRILFSNSQLLVQEAIDVLTGQKESLADGGGLKSLRSLPEDTIIAGAANSFGKILGADPQAAVLQKAEEIQVAIGEADGIDFVDVTLSTTDEETATQVHHVLQGIIALGGLMSHEQPELAKLVQSVKLKLNGKKITIREAQPADELFKLIQGMK